MLKLLPSLHFTLLEMIGANEFKNTCVKRKKNQDRTRLYFEKRSKVTDYKG